MNPANRPRRQLVETDPEEPRHRHPLFEGEIGGILEVTDLLLELKQSIFERTNPVPTLDPGGKRPIGVHFFHFTPVLHPG